MLFAFYVPLADRRPASPMTPCAFHNQSACLLKSDCSTHSAKSMVSARSPSGVRFADYAPVLKAPKEGRSVI